MELRINRVRINRARPVPGYTFVTSESVWLRYVSGRYGDSVHYGDEYYFYFYGQACTNLTGRWQALSARYF